MKHDNPIVRLCPQEDGTFHATRWDSKSEEYIDCSASLAISILAQNGAEVEVAVNDPHDQHSHYESHAKMKRI